MESPAFRVDQSSSGCAYRTGMLTTPHGEVETPAFIPVATKATIKSVPPEHLRPAGVQAVLGNTYHLYLEPTAERVEEAGGIGAFMNWNGPTFTDSGGFQVFSLGAGFGTNKFVADDKKSKSKVKIDESGVTFFSHIDGSKHRFTPTSSIETQKKIGADIIFAFDECTSPAEGYEYQEKAMVRTHRWAKESLEAHTKDTKGSAGTEQLLFGIVQGGRFDKLREKSAEYIGSLDFDGFGIGGSFSKEDLTKTLSLVTQVLPEEKPRHLLGIGEVADVFLGVEQGIDTFDCVSPTRLARTGTVYTTDGTVSLLKAEYRDKYEPIDPICDCTACGNYSVAYLAHLFRAKEMLGATLASIHNIRFMTRLFEGIRDAIKDELFAEYREETMKSFYGTV